ncbi:MAG: hypothetical protein ACPLYE_01925 [Candidatus Micrarchaeales archaeon]
MNKKIIYIGFLLLIIGIIFSYQLAASFFQIPYYSTAKVLIAPNASATISFTLNKTSAVMIAYNSTLPIDFYVVNKSAYNSFLLGNELNISKIKSAKALEVILGSRYGAFSNFMAMNQAQAQYYQKASMQNGSYYGVFVNTHNSTASVLVVYGEEAAGKNYLDLLESGSVAALLFLGGIVLIIYGLIARKKKDEEKEEGVDVQRKERRAKKKPRK